MKRIGIAVVSLSILALASGALAQDGETEPTGIREDAKVRRSSGAPGEGRGAGATDGAGTVGGNVATEAAAEPVPDEREPKPAVKGAAPVDPSAGSETVVGEGGGDAPKTEPEPKTTATAPAAPALTDAKYKALFASVSHQNARGLLEAAAAQSLATDAKTYLEWLVDGGNQTTINSAVSLVASSESPEKAEARAKTIGQLFEVVVANEADYASMNEVAQNAIDSVGRDVPYVVPPAPPTPASAGSTWTAPKVSSYAGEVDTMFYFILYLSGFCFIGITIVTLYWSWRYRHRKGHASEPSPSHNDALEITWTVVPSLLLVVVFVLGWKGFVNIMTPPRHGLEIQVVGQKWNWTFIYPNGWTDDVLHVPEDTPVRLVMRSEDVLHDFSLPALRVKQDVIPRRYTKIWFEAKDPGVYRAFCAEFCGQQHSDMKTWVQVHGPGGYDKYLQKAEEAEKTMNPLEIGKTYFAKRGCGQCHSVDGSAGTGPTFKGAWGESRQFADGSTGVVDENYIRESILEPMAKVRAGFNPVMPTFKGKLKDHQIDGLIAYIKSLK